MTPPRPDDRASLPTTTAAGPRAGDGGGWAVAAVLAGVLAVVVTLALATAGSFVLSFGIGTDCTNSYSCSTTGCAPCRAATWWLRLGWLAQVGLLTGSVGLWVPRWRRRRRRAMTAALALALTTTSVLLLAGTAHLAGGAYCREGERPGRSYCDVRATSPAQGALPAGVLTAAVEGVPRRGGA